jgi:hypothetical protein
MPFLILIPIVIVFLFIYLKKKKKFHRVLLTQTYEDLIPKDATFEKKEFEQIDLKEINSNYKSVYLVHGTFVGNDPFDLIGLLESAFPNLKSTIIEKIKIQTKNGQDFLIKDFGNFHKSITSTLEKCFPNKIEINFFNWSSSNHHYARLRGSLSLIKEIASKSNKDDRIILFGHSHAGQVFALMTQLLNNQLIRKQIIKVLKLNKDQETSLIKDIKLLSYMKFDFVTLGTPIRYSWELSLKTRLLHIINHRGVIPQGGSLSSSITTKNGDYIQQWAIEGSDILSANKQDREMNLELDLILGHGRDLEKLKRCIKFKKRLHHTGHHLLVDFKDHSGLPNSLKTIFGHAIYTQEKSMKWILNESLFYFNSLNK